MSFFTSRTIQWSIALLLVGGIILPFLGGYAEEVVSATPGITKLVWVPIFPEAKQVAMSLIAVSIIYAVADLIRGLLSRTPAA